MSDAREKALAAYQATFPEGCVGTATIRDDFTAGLDAAKADLPSRYDIAYALRKARADVIRTTEEHAGPVKEWLPDADAVLALLRGGE